MYMFIYKDKKIYVVILVYTPYSQKRNIRTLEDKAPNKRQIIYNNKNINVNTKKRNTSKKKLMFSNT